MRWALIQYDWRPREVGSDTLRGKMMCRHGKKNSVENWRGDESQRDESAVCGREECGWGEAKKNC